MIAPMKTDLAGLIRNVNVPKGQPLLPLLEAVVNSIQAIVAAKEPSGRIRIDIVREQASFTEDGSMIVGPVVGFEIHDNGVGLDDLNYDSFCTAYSSHKSSIGGKGMGRFTWPVVFQRVSVTTNFVCEGKLSRRCFDFNASFNADAHRHSTIAGESDSRGTTVVLGDPRPDRIGAFPSDPDLIAEEIVTHCFLLLKRSGAASIVLNDGDHSIDLNEYHRNYALERAVEHPLNLAGHPGTLTSVRLYTSKAGDNKLFLAGHGRSVLNQRLGTLIPNLRRSLVDVEGEAYVYHAFVESKILDDSVSPNRTDFTLPKTQHEATESGGLFPLPSIELIKEIAVDTITQELAEPLACLDAAKGAAVKAFIAERPEYRPLSKVTDEVLSSLPPEPSASEIEDALSQVLQRMKRTTRQETARILNEATAVDDDEADRQFERARSILDKVEDVQRSALAEYVINRKVALEFMDRCLAIDKETGRHRLEKILHKAIFPMRKESTQVFFESHNLWLVDERLAFHSYLASDMEIGKMEPVVGDSAIRPDLLLFDHAHVLTEGGDYHQLPSFTVFELKRPTHTDYRKDNPIEQAYDQVRAVRGKDYKTEDGRTVKLSSPLVPAYAFVLCTMTSEMERMAKNAGLRPTPDKDGYFGYNTDEELNVYIEVTSYEKLIRDAIRRNQAFFRKLGIDT